jgi:hypothetical protein
VQTFVVYLWRDRANVSITTTNEEQHVKDLQVWAESLGYRVEVSELEKKYGPQHK